MDETGCRAVSDSIYADNVIVCRADDVFGEYAVGAWNNVCGKRSAENRSTVRTRQFDEVQYDERGSRDDNGYKLNSRDSKEWEVNVKKKHLITLAAIIFLLPFAAIFVLSDRVMTLQNA